MKSVINRLLKTLRQIHFYFKYPNQLIADVKLLLRHGKATERGIVFCKPNLLFRDQFGPSSIIIDGGCGQDADLSVYMIEKFGLKAFAVDPTIKHRPSLMQIEQKYPGHFRHLSYAITASEGMIQFKESICHESGSIFTDHQNIQVGQNITYDVQTVSLRSLAELVGAKAIDFLKLDLEGAEFELIESLCEEDVAPYQQVFVEFHHTALQKFNKKDTKRAVQKMIDLGFTVFTIDDINYLFYRD